MANETPTKPSLKEKLAEVKTKREAIKKEAQMRIAAAWTIAKTMLPTAPAEKCQKAFAASPPSGNRRQSSQRNAPSDRKECPLFQGR